MDDRPRNAREAEEEQEAAREAAEIGGPVPGESDVDPAQRALLESGEGVAEGFERAEEDLVEHASHGDEQSARQAYHHRELVEEEGEPSQDGEADSFLTSERDERSDDEGSRTP